VTFKVALDYFDDPDDLIPDGIGLMGIVDDAYLAGRIIENVMAASAKLQGPDTLERVRAANEMVRPLLPRDVGDELDRRISEAMTGVATRRAMQQLGQRWSTLGHRWTQLESNWRAQDNLIKQRSELRQAEIYSMGAQAGIDFRPGAF
jgi:uncharacterized membrane protein YkvA (DUF1232 family)